MKLYRGPLSNEESWAKKFNRGYKLVYKLNSIPPENEDEIRSVVEELLGEFGENSTVLTPFYCNIGSNIKVGRGSFININCIFLDTDTIEIGDYTLVGPGVQFLAADHPVSTTERVVPVSPEFDDDYLDSDNNYKDGIDYTFTNTKKPIKIGNRSWIGAGSIILPGVTIGDNTVIGAGSIVTKDIPSDCIAVGNPCRVIRENK